MIKQNNSFLSVCYVTANKLTFSNLTLHYSHCIYEYKKRSVIKKLKGFYYEYSII